MAIAPVGLTNITRAQDFSAMKQNEDNKGMTDQANFSTQVQKNTEQQTRQVQGGDEALWQEHRPDAKEKGNGKYEGDGGRKRKKTQPIEKMVVKGHGSFDMKI